MAEEGIEIVNVNDVFSDNEMKGSLSDLKEFNLEWTSIGSPGFRIDNETLAYSINAIIHDFDPYNAGIISQTKFYKLLYLLSDSLKDENVDIKLPHYWYRFGPVVPYFILPEDIFTFIPRDWGRAVIMGKRRTFELSQEIRETIDNIVKSLWAQYHESRTNKIIFDVYKKAPYEFQRKYKEFIKHLDVKIRLHQTLPYYPLKESEDIRRLENAARSFEEDEFPQVYNDLLNWKMIVKYSIRRLGDIEPAFMLELSDIYWSKLFSKHLQVKTSQNLPDALTKSWARKLPELHKSYRRDFRKIEYKFYSNVYQSADCLDKNTLMAYKDCIKPLLK